MSLFDWSTLGIMHKVFLCIGLAGTGLVVIHSLVSMIFDTDGEVDAADGHGHSWGLFSIRGIFGFLLGFGWGGAIALSTGLSTWAAIAIATLAGLAIAIAIALFMRAFSSLRSDGTLRLDNAIGQAATVYQRVPGQRHGSGKVQVLIQGRLCTIEACTDAEADLLPPKQVTVTAVASGHLLVVG